MSIETEEFASPRMVPRLLLVLVALAVGGCAHQRQPAPLAFRVHPAPGSCPYDAAADESGGISSEPAGAAVDSVLSVEFGGSLGAVFPASFALNFNREQLQRRFTPSAELIRRIEPDVRRQYWEANVRFTRHQVWGGDEEFYAGEEVPSEEERLAQFLSFVAVANWEASRYDRFHRQYAGFYNPQGERVVLIQLLDFCADPYRLRRHLATHWIGGWHGWFESNVRLLEYNVDRNRLNAFGWGQL